MRGPGTGPVQPNSVESPGGIRARNRLCPGAELEGRGKRLAPGQPVRAHGLYSRSCSCAAGSKEEPQQAAGRYGPQTGLALSPGNGTGPVLRETTMTSDGRRSADPRTRWVQSTHATGPVQRAGGILSQARRLEGGRQVVEGRGLLTCDTMGFGQLTRGRVGETGALQVASRNLFKGQAWAAASYPARSTGREGTPSAFRGF